MSHFHMTARHKETGDIDDITCLDNFFGKRQYGYKMSNGYVMNETEFKKQFEMAE
jgi:hypothetical protein